MSTSLMLSWAMPAILLLIGWVIPDLRTSIVLNDIPPEVFKWLVGQIILSVAWLLWEFNFAARRTTAVEFLQMDDGVSRVWAVLLTGWCGAMISRGDLPWWFVVPWVSVLIESFFSGFLTINNAAQKPLMQQERR
jgi:hypothetical protein